MAQRDTGKSTRGGAARGSSGSSKRGGTTRSSSSGTTRSNTARSNSGGTTRSSRGGGKKGGGNSSGIILLKAVLFVLGIALVFGVTSWGLEKLDERSKNKTPTTTPTGAVSPGGNSTEQKPTNDPDVPTDTPTPVPTQSPEDYAASVLRGVSKSKLKLDKDLSEYRLQIDDYKSTIHGKECIGVNVLQKDKDRLVAVFYVAVDGSEIFKERDDGEFDTITP